MSRVRLDYLGHTGPNIHLGLKIYHIYTSPFANPQAVEQFIEYTHDEHNHFNATHFDIRFTGAGVWSSIEIAPGLQEERSL